MSDYNDKMIADFRENGGIVPTGHGSGLVLLHSKGAKSGTQRVHPLLGITEDDHWLVIASKGGSPENPSWYHNLLAHPETEIEVGANGHVDTVAVRAEVIADEDYLAAWAKFTDKSKAFEGYAERTARRMPIVKLVRR
ncbi:MAG: nitroreductase/quinone reductase family protein [Pseudolysinimonas sp.]